MFSAIVALTLSAVPTLALAQSAYTFYSPSVAGTSGTIASVEILLDSSAGVSLAALTVAVCNIGGTVEPVAVTPGATAANMNGGSGPGFFATDLMVDGFTAGMVFDLLGVVLLPPSPASQILDVDYQIFITTSSGSVPLVFCQIGGTTNTVVVGGTTIIAGGIDGEIVVGGVVGTVDYIRGDTNEDGSVSVTDAVVLFGRLLGIHPAGGCPRGGDVNADGARDIADVVSLFQALFTPGQAIALPFPTCGPGLILSPLPCAQSPICP